MTRNLENSTLRKCLTSENSGCGGKKKAWMSFCPDLLFFLCLETQLGVRSKAAPAGTWKRKGVNVARKRIQINRGSCSYPIPEQVKGDAFSTRTLFSLLKLQEGLDKGEKRQQTCLRCSGKRWLRIPEPLVTSAANRIKHTKCCESSTKPFLTHVDLEIQKVSSLFRWTWC